MGLMDVLNGMQNGPRGGSSGSSSGASSSGGGMSPLTMAVLGLLAYKALRSFSGGSSSGARTQPQQLPPQRPDAIPANLPAGSAGAAAGGLPGGLGDLLKGGSLGGLGGLLAGGAAGTVLSGGLNDLLKQLQDAGHADKAQSWVGKGPNQDISSDDLASALGADKIQTLMDHSGLSRQDLLAGLSQYLPEVVNQLTPEGRVPTEHEVLRSF